MKNPHQKKLLWHLIQIISETNGISLKDTLKLLVNSPELKKSPESLGLFNDYIEALSLYSIDQRSIQSLLQHPVSQALMQFFQIFPMKYKEEHIHLTGALTADFIYPKLKPLIEGPQKALYQKKITEVYGPGSWPINSIEDVDRLIRIKETEGFETYLKILFLTKLILVDRQSHADSAYHLAQELYQKFNVGQIRLKFTLSRASTNSSDQIPGADQVTSEDVVLGLFDGFRKFQTENPDFKFILSPSFRKEKDFFDASKFSNKKEAFEAQVNDLISLVDKYPYLQPVITDVDTVGNENELYRKEHFAIYQKGFRKLQYRGFKIRSHHGETFLTLKKGIQAVDNAMNIWHIDTLEHGLSLGINPNFYFHRLYQNVIQKNDQGIAVTEKDPDFRELSELDWGPSKATLEKLLRGQKLTDEEQVLFVKAKFHTAREVEHYQHDVLNRLIQKDVTLVSLPSSNNKLTGQLKEYKDHPFSWWEKKNVQLAVGTDNHIALNTNFLQEMLIVLLTDPLDLKITKLLMVTTGETRRPYISHLLWKMRKIVSRPS